MADVVGDGSRLVRGWHVAGKLEFWVNTTPVSQPRPRFRAVNGKVYAYTPSAHGVHQFKHDVVEAYYDALRDNGLVVSGWMADCAVRMDVECYFPRTRSELKGPRSRQRDFYCKSKNDWDNVGKAISDALTSRAWRDDGQLWCVSIRRYLAQAGEPVGCWIFIEWYVRSTG